MGLHDAQNGLIEEAARLKPRFPAIDQAGFRVVFYDTLEDFYLAEAPRYIEAWRQSTADNPVGICGPIGPPSTFRSSRGSSTSSSSTCARGISGEWTSGSTSKGREVDLTHPLSFERADRELCFSRIRRALRMPDDDLHFPKADTAHTASRGTPECGARSCRAGRATSSTGPSTIRCPTRAAQGRTAGAGGVSAAATRVVDLHPLTIAQNARTSGGGNISLVPTKAISVGPMETWKAEKVSIWHAGPHDNPFGQRLTALMISKRMVDSSVPMSFMADHPNVQFNYFRGGIRSCDVEMH